MLTNANINCISSECRSIAQKSLKKKKQCKNYFFLELKKENIAAWNCTNACLFFHLWLSLDKLLLFRDRSTFYCEDEHTWTHPQVEKALQGKSSQPHLNNCPLCSSCVKGGCVDSIQWGHGNPVRHALDHHDRENFAF